MRGIFCRRRAVKLGRSSPRCASFRAINPETGESADDTEFEEAGLEEVGAIARRAGDAFEALKGKSAKDIAAFLRFAADGIDALGDDFVDLAVRETALPHVRINNERARTTDQLRQFAALVEEGSWVQAHIDCGAGKDLRSMMVPVGPVAVFGASNFPLAFSVAGGDTASALAARNPVVVKAHPAHPGVSERVAAVMRDAIEATGMPRDTFGMIQSTRPEVGQALVKDPSIAAVGFTGSLRAGRALMDAAASRPRPIPVYAEMGSVNPVFVMPSALETRWETFAAGLCGSVTLGTGQFCTNPGLVIGVASDRFDRFAEHLARLADQSPAGTMLTHGIRDQFREAVDRVSAVEGVDVLTSKAFDDATRAASAPAFVMRADARDFLDEKKNAVLSEEMFGPATLLVACENADEMLRVANSLEGQLTGSVFGFADDADAESNSIVRSLQDRVGRLIFNDFPTGVDVCSSMMHGGPYPAASTAHHTSVGTTAIRRFARPLCYQDFPQDALPLELRDANPRGIMRMVNGTHTTDPIEAGSYVKKHG